MNSMRTFIFRRQTCEGLSLCGAGICASEDCAKADAVIAALTHLRVGNTVDPFDLDCRLAEYVADICPESILAIGLSLDVPGASGPSGGIIGNPRVTIESADGRATDIGHGLSLVALPGGPGIVVLGTPGDAERVLCPVCGAGTDYTVIPDLIRHIQGAGIALAMAVADGSATRCTGGVATLDNGKIQVLRCRRTGMFARFSPS